MARTGAALKRLPKLHFRLYVAKVAVSRVPSHIEQAGKRRDFLHEGGWMLDTLRKLIADFASEPETHRFKDNDYRLAAAALMVHLISVDGHTSAAETGKLHALLQSRFDLDAQAADELIREATVVEGESVDLYRFTSLILRAVDEPGRLRIVEMMWELVFADGRVNEFEESVIWRAADLLGISTRDRVELRQRVAAGRASSVAPDPA
jgi:uncharacterized tellurite resistance protein B-like protein